jgi:23S rRNA (pseudouridine1915-N3)-methyltransferase
MKITIISIGKVKADGVADLIAEYRKRLRGTVQILELPASKAVAPNLRKTQEAKAVLAALPKDAVIMVLDERGKNPTSREFAAQIQVWQNQGRNHLCVLIGGADGLDKTVVQRADMVCALGAMTWPHRLVKIMLLEQLYRAFTILDGHPYHRD